MGAFYHDPGIQAVNDVLSTFLLLSVPGCPLLLAMGLMSGPLRRVAMLFAPWVAFPALVVSMSLTPGNILELPWLLFGTRLGFDETARIFLFFTALLWLVASVYTTGYFPRYSSRARFFTWFLLAMAGNLGLILAQDMAIFYTFFTMMSFASYGLVVYDRTPEALRAGRIYIVLVALGEVLLFAAFALAAQAANSIEFEAVRSAVAGSEVRDWIIGLTLLGFGIKAGVIGLHVWLPLAHPVAPTPASAVLSGAMIAAGLLGWLRVLPLGETVLSGWGGVMIVAGVVAVFYSVLVGLMQNNPKTVLAYSSVSKMGIMTVGVGLGLIAPDSWPVILSAILIYALHHGLAKGALFLGVGMVVAPPVSKGQHRLLLAGLLLPALSLAGAPLTSGMIAKNLLTVQATSAVSPWGDWLQILLPWSSVATSILMARFLYLVWPRHKSASEAQATPKAMWLSWIVLVVVVALSPLFIPLADPQESWTEKAMISALWPVALGGGLAVCAWLAIRHQWISWSFKIPSGDLLVIVENRLCSLVASGRLFGFETLPKWRLSFLAAWIRFRDRSELWSVIDSGENRFGRWAVGTTLFLVLGMVFVFLAAC
jgi:formate hydrogenlyase subunit 3/multisubunit Na+/H+ antiporter MnhD subunit